MTQLGEFLKRQLANDSPFNCGSMPADWCMLLGHPDFSAKWRAMSDIVECEAAAEAAGDSVALWSEGIGDALPVIEDTPRAGDIGVIAAHGFQSGALFTGDRWAVRAPRGLHFLSPDRVMLLKAWRP